ncbi:hypothetical protein HOE04_01155, partial [archaeon]|nr:hypothetical protein [archaeon]
MGVWLVGGGWIDVEGSNVVDYIGVNNGSAVGGASQVDGGKFGKGFEFDGVDDWVGCGNDNSLDIGTNNNWSYFAWVNVVEDATDVVISTVDGNGRNGFNFYIDANQRTRLSITNSTVGEEESSTGTINLNEWYHVGVVYSNLTDTVIYYINGVEDSSDTYTTLLHPDGANGLRIGASSSSASSRFNGSIDEVMIWNRSLSSEEVLSLYNATRLEFNTSALDDGVHNFTAYTSDLAGNVNSSVSSFGVDSVYPTLNISSPVNGSWYGDNTPLVNVSSSEVDSGFIVPDLDGSLVSWWRMDDLNSSGDGLVDYKGVNNGSVVNATQVDNGKFGKGFEFDGDGDSVDVGDLDSLDFENNTEFTISAWGYVKGDGDGGNFMVLAGKTILSGGSDNHYYLGTRSGKFRFDVGNGSGSDGLLVSDSGYNENQWYHIVGTRNSTGNLKLYLDGMQQAEAYTIEGDISNSYTFKIGARNGGTYIFNGTIDEVMVFNRSLSASEVLSLYNATRLEFNTSELVDGVHNFTAYTSDLAGNVDSSSANFSVDTALPTLNISSPVNDSWYTNGSVLVNVSSSEVDSGFIVPDLDGSLVSWWRMDDVNGSGDLVDYNGVNNGSAVGGASQVDNGKFGKGFEFYGGGDYVDVGDLGNIKTISYWIKANSENEYVLDLDGGTHYILHNSYPVGFTDAIVYVDGVQKTALGNELVTNGGFDADSDWTLTGGWSIADGVASNDGNSQPMSQSSVQETGSFYVAEYDVTNYVSSGFRINLGGAGFTGAGSTVSANGSYVNYILADGNAVYLQSRSAFIGSVDNVSVKKINDLVSSNQWHHVVITTDTVINANSIELGKKSSKYFNGTMDEIMIFNRSLSAEEILSLYNATRLEFNTSTLADGAHEFSAYTSDLAGNVNSSSANFSVDTVAPNATSLAPVNNSYLPNGISNFTANLMDNLGLKNATLNIYQKDNTWMDFDGDGDYVGLGNPSELKGLDEMTISAWVKAKSQSTAIIGFENGGSWNWAFYTWTFSVKTDTGYHSNAYSSGSVYDADTWVHVVMMYNGTNLLIYKNNVLIDSDTSVTGTMTSANNDLRIGNNVALNRDLNGSIDEMRIYNRSLSTLEISEIYESKLIRNPSLNSSGLIAWYDFDNSDGNASNLQDYSGNGNNGTVYNATFTSLDHSSIFSSISGLIYGVGQTFSNLIDGIYDWFYEVFDLAGNSFTSENYTFISDPTFPEVSFDSSTPANGSGRTDEFEINVSIEEKYLRNITYNWDGTEYNLFDDSLVLMYNFDNVSALGENSTHVVDVSNGGNNGSWIGGQDGDSGANCSGAKYGCGRMFDGNGDYVSISDNSNINFTNTSDFTLSAWIYFNGRNSNTYEGIIGKRYSSQLWYQFYVNDVGAEEFVYFSLYDGTTSPTATGSININDGKWHLVNAVKNTTADKIYVYVDGILDDSSTDTTTKDISNNGSLFIGAVISGSYSWNGSIDEVRIFNRSLSVEEISLLYRSNLKKYDENKWNLWINQTGLAIGSSYTYNINVSDLAGNLNSTEIRTIVANSKPTFISVSNSPTSDDDLDPNTTIIVTANISDEDGNFDSALLQYRNSSDASWTNVSMVNTTAKGIYTMVNGSFTLPAAIETNYTYRVWANDSEGDSNFSSNSTLDVSWDCTWTTTSSLGSTAGWDENKWLGNITLNNTGDVEFGVSNCSLDFRLTYDLAEGRIYYDGFYYKSSLVYTISTESYQNITINATFGTEIKQEDVIITIDEISSRSNNSQLNTSATIVSNQAGPYLSQTISSSPSNVYLTSGDFSLQGYLRNLMGSVTVNENNTAYNVSFNWTLPEGLTNVSGNSSVFYENISGSGLNNNNLEVGFSSLASMSPGVLVVSLYSEGYNLSGDLINDAYGNLNLFDSVNITFLCYEESDGVCVTACGYLLDSDCSAPAASTPGASAGGGGGGGGSRRDVDFFSSSQDLQLVRGEQNEIIVTIENKYDNDSLEDLSFSVIGDIAKYVRVSPAKIWSLKPGEKVNVSLIITSPTYVKLGRQELTLLINGIKGFGDYKESKKFILEIHELSGDDAYELLDDAREWIVKLEEANLSYDYLNELLNESEMGIKVFDYELVRDNHEIILELAEAGLKTKKIIEELNTLLDVAREKGIDIDG